MEWKPKIRDHEDEFVSKSNIFKGPFICVNFFNVMCISWISGQEQDHEGNCGHQEDVLQWQTGCWGKPAKTTLHWFINNGVYTNIDLITGTVQAS